MYKAIDNKVFPNKTGVYAIRFIGSDRVYVGSASSTTRKSRMGFRARWMTHIVKLKSNKGSIRLQKAYDKYSIQNMYFEILEECNPKDCKKKEKYWIDYFNSYKNGYNGISTSEFTDNWEQCKEAIERCKKTCFNKFLKKAEKYRNEIEKLYYKYRDQRIVATELNLPLSFIKKVFNYYNIDILSTKGQRGKKVYVYSLNGDLLSEHRSIVLACQFYGLKHRGHISNIVKGKGKRYKGMTFSSKLLSKEEVLEKIKRKSNK